MEPQRVLKRSLDLSVNRYLIVNTILTFVDFGPIECTLAAIIKSRKDLNTD